MQIRICGNNWHAVELLALTLLFMFTTIIWIANKQFRTAATDFIFFSKENMSINCRHYTSTTI